MLPVIEQDANGHLQCYYASNVQMISVMPSLNIACKYIALV
jgi:hypothetical protein